MKTIEFRAHDLIIKETEEGDEVVNIKGSLAFDKDFIDEMKEQGVKKYTPKEDE